MKKIKFLKLRKVKIANVNITNKMFGGGKTDFCDTDSCDVEAQCIPETTQGEPTSNNDEECTGSVLQCGSMNNQNC